MASNMKRKRKIIYTNNKTIYANPDDNFRSLQK